MIKGLTKAAQRVFTHFMKLAKENGGHAKIGEDGDVFMPVSVEKIGENAIGPVYSVAHYFIRNGDLMADPEMTFQVDSQGEYVDEGYAIPISFRLRRYGREIR